MIINERLSLISSLTIIIELLLCNIHLSLANEITNSHTSSLSSSSSSLLIGNRITCDQEGQIVEIPFIQKTDPCIVCMCRNSFIDCFRYDQNSTICKSSILMADNDNDKNCYHYGYRLQHQQTKRNQTEPEHVCCKKKVCLNCRTGDKIISNGQIYQDNHSCQLHYCHSGTLTSTKMRCYVPCDRPIRFLGQCCPSCNACPLNVPDGHEIDPIQLPMNNDNKENSCIRCYCFKGQLICHRYICPVLPCPRSEWIQTSNVCCPKCKPSSLTAAKVLQLSNGSCVMGDQFFEHSQKFTYDSCTECVCKNGTNICHRRFCTEEEKMKTKILEESSTVNLNRNVDVCQHKLIRRSDNQKFCHNISNEQNNENECIINDSWSNITTFDGHNYRIIPNNDNYLCNRILMKNCETNKFSLHLLHRYIQQNNTLKYRGSSLSLRIKKDIRIILNHKGKIRIIENNRKQYVKLPFIQMGQFSIVKDKFEQNSIRLHAIIGLDLWWQPNKSIKIQMNNNFRNNLCGLCGNFDGQPSNDEQLAQRNNKCRNKISKKLLNKNSTTQIENFNNQPKICHTNKSDYVQQFCQRFMRRYRTQLKQCTPKELQKSYENCLQNVCRCYNNNDNNNNAHSSNDDRQCLCYSMQNFLDNCNKNDNNTLSNDSNDVKLQIPMCKSLQCPPGSKFNFCSNQCRRRTCPPSKQSINYSLLNDDCNNNQNDGDDNDRCVPQCECIGNRVWHNNNICIPEMMCTLFQ